MSRVSQVQKYMDVEIAAKRRKFTAQSGRVLPYMEYTRMRRWTEYGLSLSIEYCLRD